MILTALYYKAQNRSFDIIMVQLMRTENPPPHNSEM